MCLDPDSYGTYRSLCPSETDMLSQVGCLNAICGAWGGNIVKKIFSVVLWVCVTKPNTYEVGRYFAYLSEVNPLRSGVLKNGRQADRRVLVAREGGHDAKAPAGKLSRHLPKESYRQKGTAIYLFAHRRRTGGWEKKRSNPNKQTTTTKSHMQSSWW